MTKKYLYGNLNQEAVRPNYGGSTTDSVTIHVDNENMVISGEVNWNAALGELANKAYPGDKGARNYQKILELSSILEQEVDAASKSRDTVESKVGYIEKFVNEQIRFLTDTIKNQSLDVDKQYKELLDQCIAEATRAISSESELLRQLKNEVTERTTIDDDLVKRLDKLENVSTSSFESIKTLVTNESARAQLVEYSLQKLISDETTRATSEENDLDFKINSLSDSFNKIVEDLRIFVDAESLKRSETDKNIEDLIRAESERSLTADNKLETRIISIEKELTNIPDVIDDNRKSIESIVTKIESVTDDINDVNDAIKEESLKRQADINSVSSRLDQEITLREESDSTLNTNVRSIQTYIDSIVKDVEILENQSSNLKSRILKLEQLELDDKRTFLAELTKLNTVSYNIEEQLDLVKLIISSLQKDVSSNRTDIESTQGSISDIISRIKSCENTLDNVNQIIVLLQHKNSVTEDTIRILSEKTDKLIDDTANLSVTIEKEITDRIDSDSRLLESLLQLKSKVDTDSLEIDGVKNTLTSQSILIKDLQSSSSVQDKLIENLQTKTETLSDKVTAQDTTLKKLDDKLSSQDVSHKKELVKHDDLLHEHEEEIETLKEDVTALINTDVRTSIDIAAVNTRLDEEIELHRSHYRKLLEELQSEINRAINQDKEHINEIQRNSNRITQLQTDLTNVITRYVDELRKADYELNDKLAYESYKIQEWKTQTLKSLENVSEESLQRDSILQEQIEELQTRKDSVPIILNDGSTEELYAQRGDVTSTIPVEKSPVAGSVVRRDSVGNIILVTDEELLTDYSAVPKTFVKNLVDELRSELTYDFIDGGTAPTR